MVEGEGEDDRSFRTVGRVSLSGESSRAKSTAAPRVFRKLQVEEYRLGHFGLIRIEFKRWDAV